MASESLSFDTGVVEYDVNGACKIRFNPTDVNFADRYVDAVKSLLDKQDSFADGEYFGRFIELDAEMRVIIDGLLGEGVSDALFGDMNCYAFADGWPVWLNLFTALFDTISSAFEREFGRADARTKLYNEKCEKMLSKYRKNKRG